MKREKTMKKTNMVMMMMILGATTRMGGSGSHSIMSSSMSGS